MSDSASIDLRRLKLALVAQGFRQSGAERQLCYLVHALTGAGAQVRLFAQSTGGFFSSRVQELGVQPVPIGGGPSPRSMVRALLKELQQQPCDVLQSQHFEMNTTVATAGRALRIPHIGALRSDGLHDATGSGARQDRGALTWPRFLAANSLRALRFASRQGVPEGRLLHLPNVVDAEAFPCVSRPLRKEFQIGIVGRLAPEKRIDRFLRSLRHLQTLTSHPFRGWVIGDGPLRGDLESLTESLGLRGVVEFTGPTDTPATRYATLDALVLTSDWEGVPNVVLEAMSTGLAVVATRVGGLAEILTDQVTGRLVDPEDEPSLAECLAGWLSHPETAYGLGQRAAGYVREHHSLRNLPQVLGRFYRRVLGGGC